MTPDEIRMFRDGTKYGVEYNGDTRYFETRWDAISYIGTIVRKECLKEG